MNAPLAYFITFTCHGTWLHGDDRGSVDRTHSDPETPVLPPDALRRSREYARLQDLPYTLDVDRRAVALAAIRGIACRKGWRLLAVHVRSNHIHVVVEAPGPPERVMNDLKTAASRSLNRTHPEDGSRPRWTRHGSTRYLWTDDAVVEKVDYVLNGQGEPMARYPES